MNQRERYNQIWSCGDVQKPEVWSVWEVVKDFQGKRNLEIGPGNYPKIPIESGFFVDISEIAIENLKKQGARAFVGDITNLPFKDEFFDLVVAIEVLEHIKDDKKGVKEIARVLKPDGFFLFSLPLRMDLYSEIDQIVGHERRYEVGELKNLLLDNDFKILKYRYPSFYLKILDICGILFLTKFLCKRKCHTCFFHLPKFLVNFFSRTLAFLDKKGAPKWQTDIENLSKYKDRGIVLFCQKNENISEPTLSY